MRETNTVSAQIQPLSHPPHDSRESLLRTARWAEYIASRLSPFEAMALRKFAEKHLRLEAEMIRPLSDKGFARIAKSPGLRI
jgi:hypothetical protein